MTERWSARRLAASASISLLGILALITNTAHIATEQLNDILFVGIIFPVGVSVALIGTGVWLYRSNITATVAPRVAAWTVGGALIGIIFGYPVVPYQAAHGVTIVDIPFLITNWAASSALMGFLVGVYDARRREYQAELERERDTLADREAELERQNERLEKLTSVLSHDIRNPLNVAMARVELAHRDHDDGGDVNADDANLSDALAALDRIDTLIDDTLTLARLDNAVNNPGRVTLRGIAEQSWDMVDTGDAELVVADDTAFEADADRAQQVFENLFRNAVEHSDEDVTVEVGALTAEDAHGFYVADDGPGIPADDRDDVFEHGYTTSDAGTGLGLSIVQEISDAHGWDVTVGESDAGGARFEFRGVDIDDGDAA